MRGRGCRALRAQLCDCVGVEGGRTGARRHPDVQVAPLDVHASEASLTRASDARQWSGNVSVDARAGAGDVGVGVGAGADVGAAAGAYGCEDAGGCGRGHDRADVGSVPSFEVVVEAALVRQEDASDGGCASADAGARVNGSGGTDCHASVHTAVVHAGGVHRDPNAMALVPM
jgi:hypothetical protein